MSIEQTILLGLGLGFSVLGWFARELWAAVHLLRSDLSALNVKISAEYVRYDRLHDAFQPLREQLSRIEMGLLSKADK